MTAGDLNPPKVRDRVRMIAASEGPASRSDILASQPAGRASREEHRNIGDIFRVCDAIERRDPRVAPVAFRTASRNLLPFSSQSRFFGSSDSSEGTKSPHRRTEMKSQQIKEITEKATEQLVAALLQGHSETLAGYLKAIGRFHRYSLHNILLIALQKPNASHVAGFHTWNQLGRFVKKGEKGIMILVPILRRKAENFEDEEKESPHIAGFRAAYVFDVSQTDGQDLPQIGVVRGDPRENGAGLRRFAAAQNIAIEYSQDIAPARGTSYGGRIALLPCQSPAEEFATLVHELAHELLHRGDRREQTSRKVRETEAEATAFVVCHAIGLETGSSAADYIQLWNGDKKTLTDSLTYIQKAASQMLTALTDP
jgi:antirestriction protein ArdC